MYTVLFALIGRAFVLVRARAGFYALATGLTIAAEGAVMLALPGERGFIVCGGLVQSMLAAVVYARVAADNAMVHARSNAAPPFDVTGRVLERLWAVIVIDFLLALGAHVATVWSAPLGETGAMVAQLGVLVASILLLFSDISATVDDGANFFNVLPRSIWRSVRYVFSRNAPFVFLVLALQYLLDALASLITYAVAPGDTPTTATFWLSLALGTLTIPPLGALATLVYVEVPRLREKG